MARFGPDDERRGADLDGQITGLRINDVDVAPLALAELHWIRFGLRPIDDTFSTAGLPFAEWDRYAPMVGVDLAAAPTFAQVLAVHADRAAQVSDLFAALRQDDLAEPARRLPPWEQEDRTKTVGECLGVVVTERWAHRRFVGRDLDRLAEQRGT